MRIDGRKLGAALAINYHTQDFVAEVKRATEGRGASVVLDMVGGDYLARNLQALADEGYVVEAWGQVGQDLART